MEASGTAVVRQRERDRARLIELAMCTPECLAELLCRYGKTADTQSLAKEMKTSERGTSLLALVEVAKRHGLDTKGLFVTEKGLRKQPLPLIR